MADLHKFTTKEVLNKVLLDSSGNAVAALSHTTQEALNAVLDSANSRLNVSLVGGTISGDVTIAGDLTIEGDSAANVSEVITGTMEVTSSSLSSFTRTSSETSAVRGALYLKHTTTGNMVDGFGTGLSFQIRDSAGVDNDVAHIFGIRDGGDNQGALTFSTNASGGSLTERMRINVLGNVGINTDSPTLAKLQINTDSNYRALVINATDSNASYMQFSNTTSGTTTSDGLQLGLQADETAFISLQDSGKSLQLNTGGVARFKLDDNSRISLSNNDSFDSGTSNTVFGKSIGNIDAGSNYNVFIGEEVASDGTLSDATNNVIIGYQAGEDLTTADNCVFIGYQAGQSHSQSSGSTAVGYRAMYNSSGLDNWGNTFFGFGAAAGNWTTAASNGNVGVGYQVLHGALNDADYNVAVGYQAGYSMTEGTENVAIGEKALYAGTTNSYNVVIGAEALKTANGGENNNVAIGWGAGQLIDNGGADENVFIGTFAGKGGSGGLNKSVAVGANALKSTGGYSPTGQVAIGHDALAALTSGNRTTAVGYQAGQVATSIDYTTIVGYQAGLKLLDSESNTLIGYNAGFSLGSDLADNNTFIGTAAGLNGDYSTTNNNTANNNVGIGKSAMGGKSGSGSSFNFTGHSNVAVGLESLRVVTSGNSNVAVGSYSGYDLSEGAQNTLLGHSAGENITDGNNNVLIGHRAGYTANQTGSVGIGYRALYTNAGAENVAIGYDAGFAISSGTSNTIMGYQSGTAMTNNTNNVVIGYEAFKTANDGENNNVVIGANAGDLIDSSGCDNNVIIGFEAGRTGTGSMSHNVVIGRDAMKSIGSSSQTGTVAIGSSALTALTSGAYNTAIGYQTLKTEDTANFCTAIGYQALTSQNNSVTNTASNTAVGYKAGYAVTNAYEATLIGSNAGVSITTGTSNTGVGSSVMAGMTTGDYNTAVGVQALNTDDVGRGSTAIGYQALYSQNSDSNDEVTGNSALGYHAGYNMTTGTNNTLLGYEAGKDMDTGNNNVVIGYLAGENVDSGIENTIIGVSAGDTITGGDYNTILGRLADGAATANGQIAVGYGALTSGAYGIRIGYSGTAQSNSTVIGGFGISSEQTQQTIIGHEGVFKFVSKKYEADHASNDDGDIASSHSDNLKIPANSVIKSVSAIITRLSDLGTYNLSVVMSDDSSSPADDSGMTNPVELIGAGATTSKSGGSGNASDIECASSGGHAVKASFYNGFDGNGQHVGAGAKYIHLVNAGTGNGDTDPGTAAQVKILVEYVGME